MIEAESSMSDGVGQPIDLLIFYSLKRYIGSASAK